MKKRRIDITLIIVRIFIVVICLVSVSFFSYQLIGSKVDDIKNAMVEGYSSGYGFMVLATIVVFGSIQGTLFVVSGIGLAVGLINDYCKINTKHARNFGILMGFIVICFLLPFLLAEIVGALY